MPAQKSHDRGWAIVSTGIALMVVLYMSVWGGSLVRDWNERQNWLRSATQASRFTQAVKSYTGRYYDTLLSTAPVTVTPAMLKNTGFLEPGFTENNDYGQLYLASVVRYPVRRNHVDCIFTITFVAGYGVGGKTFVFVLSVALARHCRSALYEALR